MKGNDASIHALWISTLVLYYFLYMIVTYIFFAGRRKPSVEFAAEAAAAVPVYHGVYRLFDKGISIFPAIILLNNRSIEAEKESGGSYRQRS